MSQRRERVMSVLNSLGQYLVNGKNVRLQFNGHVLYHVVIWSTSVRSLDIYSFKTSCYFVIATTIVFNNNFKVIFSTQTHLTVEWWVSERGGDKIQIHSFNGEYRFLIPKLQNYTAHGLTCDPWPVPDGGASREKYHTTIMTWHP